MTFEEIIAEIKASIEQYEEGAIEDRECFNYVVSVVYKKLQEGEQG